MNSVKEIADLPGYSADREGGIWSLKGRQPRRLKPGRHAGGYLQVVVMKDGKRVCRRVHRLVLETFVGPCPDGMECRHLDGNPENNHIDNLEWGTPGENLRDRVRHGTHHEVNKTHCPQNHPYDETNTYRPPGNPSARLCRTCRAERKAA